MKKQALLLSTILASSILTASAQYNVSTAGKKNILIEEGTGAWCGHCTDGIMVLEQIRENNPRVLIASIHNGDAMVTADGNAFVSAYIGGFPRATFDRVKTAADPAKVGISRGNWPAASSERLSQTAQFDVDMTHNYDPATRKVTVTVKAKAISNQTGKFNINAYILEDSVTGSGNQYDQVNYYDGTPGHMFQGQGAIIPNFQHMQVLRAMLGGVWGTDGIIADNPAAGNTYQQTFSYTLPSGQKAKDIKLIGLVQKHQSAPADEREIMNAVEARMQIFPTGVDNVVINDVMIFPNPANDILNVRATIPTGTDVAVSMVNTLGQTVFTQQYDFAGSLFVESIPTSGLANVVYYVNINAGGETKMEKIVINR